MKVTNIYALIHSPLVGNFTWSLVAEEMRQRGLDVIVPLLKDSPASNDPYWKQHSDSFAQALASVPEDVPVTLVAHSGAGPLLPILRESIPNPVFAYVLVDAGIPRLATRLEMMKSEDSNWADQFQKFLEEGGRFPDWSSDDFAQIVPDGNIRTQLIGDLRPRALDFFTELIPVSDHWPDASCVYILFSPPYKRAEAEARQMGWQTYELEAEHFHMLVDPKAVADIIVDATHELHQSHH